MESDYIKILKERLPIMKQKLKDIEKIHGKNSERWHIANANLLEHKYLIENGIPKNLNQSVEVPYDLIEGF